MRFAKKGSSKLLAPMETEYSKGEVEVHPVDFTYSSLARYFPCSRPGVTQGDEERSTYVRLIESRGLKVKERREVRERRGRPTAMGN